MRTSDKYISLFLIAVAIVLAGVVGWADWLIRSELSILPFYLAPIALVAWNVRGSKWVYIAIAAGIVWCLAQKLDPTYASSGWVLLWNALMRLTTFLVVGALLAELRIRIDGERAVLFDEHGIMTPAGLESHLRTPAMRRSADRLPGGILMLNVEPSMRVAPEAHREVTALICAMVVKAIREHSSDSGLIIRTGHLDFTLLLPGKPSEECERIASALRAEIQLISTNTGHEFIFSSLLGLTSTVPVASEDVRRDLARELVVLRVTAPGSHRTAMVGSATSTGIVLA